MAISRHDAVGADDKQQGNVRVESSTFDAFGQPYSLENEDIVSFS